VADHEAQKLARGYTEDAFRRVELPPVGPEVSEGLRMVSDEVLFLLGLDDHIVDIDLDISEELRLQTLLDRLLVGGDGISLVLYRTAS